MIKTLKKLSSIMTDIVPKKILTSVFLSSCIVHSVIGQWCITVYVCPPEQRHLSDRRVTRTCNDWTKQIFHN